MTAGPRIDRYDWAGGSEAMLRFGPADAPAVVVAMPLFEEANRTRAVVAATLRALAGRGIAGVLPDLPGQGDSPVPTEAMTLAGLRAAFAAAVTRCAAAAPTYVAAIRSGTLVEAPARGCWRWSPQDGDSLRRELARIEGRESGTARAEPTRIAGNPIAPAFLDGLAGLVPIDRRGATRVVRLEGDPRPADRHFPGAPPWRRAEPGGDAALATALAADLGRWVSACEGR